jgi:hypothetical protein
MDEDNIKIDTNRMRGKGLNFSGPRWEKMVDYGNESSGYIKYW